MIASMDSSRNIPVFLALGSNIEPRRSYLDRAIKKIRELPSVLSLKESIIIETLPVGPSSGMYLNMALELEVTDSPKGFLTKTLAIESSLGRKREIWWGDRTIDIDIIFWGDSIVNQPHLKIPHPLMGERLFVLEPLMDLDPAFVNPANQKTVKELYLLLKEKTDES
jgi:2-amino-4-hydroxy-6-hydroxymethyldihydropteridine diphosphokinase